MHTPKSIVIFSSARNNAPTRLRCAYAQSRSIEHLDNGKRMLIRIVLPHNEEGLFNADCSVALLLDTIKKRHQISRQDAIDLCSLDGHVKHLWSHLSDNGAAFFELRELCIVVKVATESGKVPTYVPALEEYCKDEDFIATLNSTVEGHQSSGWSKQRKRSNHRAAGHEVKPATPDGGKGRAGRRRGPGTGPP